jgi:hypothetical protein
MSWEDRFDQNDGDEELESWQQPESTGGDDVRLPTGVTFNEPSACTVLERLAVNLGAATGRYEYAAVERYIATRLRIKARWPRRCQGCGAEFRGPKAESVRCARCRRQRRARR